MKIQQETLPYRPITLTIETRSEAEALANIMDMICHCFASEDREITPDMIGEEERKIMRTNLITHFYCATCGHQLEVEYDEEESPRKVETENQTTREPTGAACRYNRILVAPCRQCIEQHTKPAKQLADAIKALTA